MSVSTDDIKKLREMSGAGMMDCKKALADTGGDIEKAAEQLRKKGLVKAAKRMDRETAVGRIVSYIHGGGSIGVLLQLNCETDFVAKNEEFEALGRDLCMQIAAANPLALLPEELDAETVEKEKAIHREQLEKEGKKGDVIEKILPGKLNKFYSEVCLLKQPWIKDPKVSIEDLIKQYISKFGENITVGRFARYEVS
ncbi:MAG: translation elongation factor Ts [Leptospiraceae bacterium]|nr:translation elongation factor Ts [Leptospiraceae bacterium]MCB1316232.1 translation elongation factor Ts [Leptospiraceae bacterium]MCB1322138.1 translation elongation factor Ts [Leptospiraceae bacterium]